MTDQSQRFYQAIAQPPKSAGGAVAKSNAEGEPKGAVAQTLKSGKKKGLLDGVMLK
jgi:hypothetical protein